MDKLKKYLKQHEAEMDFDAPDDSVWQRIETDMPASSGGGTIYWIKRIAIAACLVGITGFGIWLIVRNDKKQATTGEIVQKENPVKKENLPFKDTSVQLPSKEMVTVNPPAPDSIQQPVQRQRKQATLARAEDPVAKEISTISEGYNRVINYERRKLRATAVYAEGPDYFSLFTKQLRRMDKDEQRIRKDFATYGTTPELLEQLINLYQQKLNILKNLQAEINKMNNKMNEKQAPSKKASKFYLNI